MKAIDIKLWGTLVGNAIVDKDGICKFQYDESFINNRIEISPITMPLSNRVYSFKLSNSFFGLPGMLADSLPDKFGNKIINAWLQKNGRSLDSFTNLERLCYIGTRGMGALEYHPALSFIKNNSDIIELHNIVKVCNEILTNKENVLINEDDNYINQLNSIGTSAGGARAKAIVAYNKSSGIFKSGQIDAGHGFDYYIIKFGNIKHNSDKEDDDNDYHTRIEYAYYLMAKNAGINMTDSMLINNNGYHFMTKRFDRFINSKGNMEKLHMQSLAGIAHFDFNNPGTNSYEQVVPIMQQLQISFKDIEEFYKRMVFNVIFRNQDDHVKNISFLMNKQGEWKLSPAYDLTLAYNPNGFWTNKHQMTIIGKQDNFSFDDLMQSGKIMGITTKKSISIINEVMDTKQTWRDCAYKAFLPNNIIEEVENKFIKL